MRGERYYISIHALREEGDHPYRPSERGSNISIHALREEGDMHLSRGCGCLRISIHALREEGDAAPGRRKESPTYFYPRPPRGGRRRLPRGKHPGDPISIHALREEGDKRKVAIVLDLCEFLSTPSARRATSTMPARAGSCWNFYPRPPRGGRPRPSPSTG